MVTRRAFLRLTASLAAAAPISRAIRAGTASATFPIADRWRWRLHVGGEVAHPRLYDLHDVLSLPSRFASISLRAAEDGPASSARWEGLHLSTLVHAVQPAPDALFVHVHCADGHRDCFTLSDLLRPRALFATSRELWYLMPREGGPLRLVLPWRTTARCPVAIERIEFHREPLPGLDPLGDLLPNPGEDGSAGTPEHLDDAAALLLEIPAPQFASGPFPEWDALRNPPSIPDPEAVAGYVRNLADPSFTLANGSRTSLILLRTVDLLDPEREDSPVRTPLLAARLYAQDILAESSDPRAAGWAATRLSDPSPLVQAMALETAIRHRLPAALPAALDCLDHPDPGLAQVAATGVMALASPRDSDALGRLAAAQAATTDAARLALLAQARHTLERQ